jgi:hypothetical protein
MEQLPLSFLIGALFLPRISLLVAYFSDVLTPFSLNGWVPPTLGVLIPRALVLVLIFQDRGFSLWLLVHAIAMAVVYSGGGSAASD